MDKLQIKKDITYIDSRDDYAPDELGEKLFTHINEIILDYAEIVIVCIGTDRITGDSLGPLTGHKLLEKTRGINGVTVYGTLEQPIHAKNIRRFLKSLWTVHKDPLILAVDASLGRRESVGHIRLGEGPINPGAGLNKTLPQVGHIFIMGVVNYKSDMDYSTLQNTSLSTVVFMADVIAEGIMKCLNRIM